MISLLTPIERKKVSSRSIVLKTISLYPYCLAIFVHTDCICLNLNKSLFDYSIQYFLMRSLNPLNAIFSLPLILSLK